MITSSISDKALLYMVQADDQTALEALIKRWAIPVRPDTKPEVVQGIKKLKVPSVTAAKKILKSYQ